MVSVHGCEATCLAGNEDLMTTKRTTLELRRDGLVQARHAADLRLMAQGLTRRADQLQRGSEALLRRSERPGNLK